MHAPANAYMFGIGLSIAGTFMQVHAPHTPAHCPHIAHTRTHINGFARMHTHARARARLHSGTRPHMTAHPARTRRPSQSLLYVYD